MLGIATSSAVVAGPRNEARRNAGRGRVSHAADSGYAPSWSNQFGVTCEMPEYARILDIVLPRDQSAFLWGPRKTGKSTL